MIKFYLFVYNFSNFVVQINNKNENFEKILSNLKLFTRAQSVYETIFFIEILYNHTYFFYSRSDKINTIIVRKLARAT